MGPDQSPLTRLLEQPNFTPLSGPRAFRILKMAEERLEVPPFKKSDILKAVSSLGMFTENEVAMMCALGEKLCLRCGECCRTLGLIIFTKQELKRISNSMGLSYKKLKQKVRAQPRGDGTFSIRGVCPFYQDNACAIYDLRPQYCKNYPTMGTVQALRDGKPEEVPDCPIVDRILLEMAVKRVIEERMFQEDYEGYQKMVDKRLNERARLLDLPSQVRIQYLISRYKRLLEEGFVEEIIY
ncbi:MAG: YkgJ family cysteine cluster protein [Candidatus Bathyarchaeia archaeon]